MFGIDPAFAPVHSAHMDLEVYDANRETLMLFLSLHTQWRTHPTTSRIYGLDYPAMETVLRVNRVKQRANVFAELQDMETAALEVFNRG